MFLRKRQHVGWVSSRFYQEYDVVWFRWLWVPSVSTLSFVPASKEECLETESVTELNRSSKSQPLEVTSILWLRSLPEVQDHQLCRERSGYLLSPIVLSSVGKSESPFEWRSDTLIGVLTEFQDHHLCAARVEYLSEG